jgi:hypothetical protein
MIRKIYKILKTIKTKTKYRYTRHIEDTLDIINSDSTPLLRECRAGNIDKVKTLLNSRYALGLRYLREEDHEEAFQCSRNLT